MERLPPALSAELDALGLGAAGFGPPADVARAAREGLALRERHGRGGTDVGVARACGLAASRAQSAADMRVIAAWFARFSGLRGKGNWDDPIRPSAGYIAWMLWGGDAGRAWAERLRPEWDVRGRSPAAAGPPDDDAPGQAL